MNEEKIDKIKNDVREMGAWDQVKLARAFSAHVLLTALYEQSYDIDAIKSEVCRSPDSLINVFDERSRLRVLVDKFGEIILAITDAQYEKGDRSDGWRDLSRTEMRDIVIEAMMTSLQNTKKVRDRTKNIEKA